MNVALAATTSAGLGMGMTGGDQQCLSSPEAATATPPHMHTLQPMMSDLADSSSDFINSATSFGDMETSCGQLDLQKMSGYDVTCNTVYPDQYISNVVNYNADVKPEFTVQPDGSFGAPAVPYLTSVPTAYQPTNASQYYLQQADMVSHLAPDSSPATSACIGSPAVPAPMSHPSVASGSPLSLPGVELNAVGLTQNFGSPRPVKADVPAPPKKPLTPYMRFSKGIWQRVKAANPGLSVCEVGAMIGRMWRELSDLDKQQFNEEFARDKAQYDEELQRYLLTNGLQASDLVKPRAKKKETAKDKSPANHHQVTQQSPSMIVAQPSPSMMTAEQMAEEMARTILQSAGMSNNAGTAAPMARNETGVLPHFSQVWSGQDQYGNSVSESLPVSTDNLFGSTIGLVVSQQPVSVCSEQGSLVYSYSRNQLPPVVAQTAASQYTFGNLTSDQASTSVTDDSSWLWQQYGVGQGVSAGDKPQSTPNGPVSKELTSSSDDALEPGEVRVSGTSVGRVPPFVQPDAGLVYPWPDSNKDVSELALLRCALVAKGKEAARLTQELELAYGLIQRLQQQNLLYQQLDWNLQQQQQQQQQQHLEQQQGEQSLEQIIAGTIGS